MKETIHVRRLAEYFKKNLRKGYTVDSLKWALINQGYQRTSVEESLELANRELAKEAPVLKEQPIITHEILDEKGKSVEIKKSWWKRFLGI
jgi:phage tail protein X